MEDFIAQFKCVEDWTFSKPDENSEYLDLFIGKSAPSIIVTPSGCHLFQGYTEWYQKYLAFDVYEDDVWVVTFPKSGTTWMQELVWCLLNDFQYEKGKEILLMKRFPFFEWDSLVLPDVSILTSLPDDDPCKPTVTWNLLNSMAPPRPIKSHLPKDLLPKQLWRNKGNVIYVCRDPRDTCVSLYYQYVRLVGYKSDFNHFVQLFLDNLVAYAPYWDHVLGFWKIRNDANILFVRYEDMIEDLEKVVKEVAEFLGVLVTESQLASLIDHLSFDNMKDNKAVNNEAIVTGAPKTENGDLKFMRKGKAGDWKNHFTAKNLRLFKTWTEQNLKKEADANFPYYQDYPDLS